uniref:Lipase domain-containing protein n=1 Tax=Caenorhabditis japonica TaxID=281687 RepID=A0A8R1E2R7_CAEJA
MLERTDLGLDASFGGRDSASETINNQAVIIVHGITNKASRFAGTAAYLRSKGYKGSEIYATTWGDGGKTPVGLVEMKCNYVKQIRALYVRIASTKSTVFFFFFSSSSIVLLIYSKFLT